jgi:hypothetical protein
VRASGDHGDGDDDVERAGILVKKRKIWACGFALSIGRTIGIKRRRMSRCRRRRRRRRRRSTA